MAQSTCVRVAVRSLIYICILATIDASKTISIPIMTNLNTEAGGTEVGGVWFAMKEINANATFLPNVTFVPEVMDIKTDRQESLLIALEIAQKQNNEQSITFPITQGAPWSKFSVLTNPILGVFNMGQISSSSTSDDLSNTNKYPYFYRTIASDSLQAQGLIELCKAMNWTTIAVVYADDPYGFYFFTGIKRLAEDNSIDVKISISVTYEINEEDNILSYESAATKIADSEVFIIICIIHQSSNFWKIFYAHGLMQYPYYILGADGWLHEGAFDEVYLNSVEIDGVAFNNISVSESNLLKGVIGTTPWKPNSLPLDAYGEDDRLIINESMSIYENLISQWNEAYGTTKGDLYLFQETPAPSMIYAYDSMHVIANVVDELGVDVLFNLTNGDNDDGEELINLINDIITNNIDFIGATGHVSFDESGDRQNGFFTFGNVVDNGMVESFGYFYLDPITGNAVAEFDVDNITWPDKFTNIGITPSSDKIYIKELQTIGEYVGIIMICLLGISGIIALVSGLYIVAKRENKVIKSASPKMNLIMCFGAVFGYVAGILYAIDEQYVSDEEKKLDTLCNIRFWMIIMGYTLLFMPLFVKTYRLSLIFKKTLTRKIIDDKRLGLIVLCCVIVDIVLLSIFTGIQPLDRVYVKSQEDEIDLLRIKQPIIGQCEWNEANNILHLSFYAFLFVFKIAEMLFGIYVAVDVSRIRDITGTMSKFDETGIQLLSIFCTVIIICIAAPIFGFGPIDSPNFHCLVITISVCLIGNIVVLLNLYPRICAVVRGREDKILHPPKKELELAVIGHLEEQLSKENGLPPKSTKLQSIRTSSRGILSYFSKDSGGSTPRSPRSHDDTQKSSALSGARRRTTTGPDTEDDECGTDDERNRL